MNTKLLQTIMAVHGQNINLVTERPLKLKKKAKEEGHEGTKHSVTKVRLGVAYDNMGSVKEKREDGTLPEQSAGLPWGEWFAFPYLIKHNGELYLSCKKPSDPNFTPKATIVLDGKEVTKQELQESGLCLSSELKPKQELDTFTVKVADVVQLGDLKVR